MSNEVDDLLDWMTEEDDVVPEAEDIFDTFYKEDNDTDEVINDKSNITVDEDGVEYEEETFDMPGSAPVTVKYVVPKKPTLDYEVEMWDTIDQFEKDAWAPKSLGLKSGWKQIDDAFDGGVKSGFIVVGGDSNLGKSGFMSQLAWQIATMNNDKAYVMDFSLDDPMKDKLPRIVGSMQKVLLNAVKTPGQYKHLPLMLARRKEGMIKLRQMVNNYRSYDANFTTFIEDIEEEVKRVMVMIDAAGLDKRIVVLIDNMHDLNIKTGGRMTDKEKYDTIAQWCSDLAIKYDITVIASAELKKLNGTRRPALDDIREAVKIKYEAKAVLLVYNEVHYKGEGSQVYFMRTNNPLRQPVFEVHFAKNKFHTYKGRLFFEFYPEMARFEAADDQSAKQYANVVFSS